MKQSEKSMIVFSVYLLIIGATIMIAPDFSLGVFGLEPSQDNYVRVMGVFLLYLAFFYFMSGWRRIGDFILLTVYARCAVIIYITVFIFLGWLSWKLILFGLIDFASAMWTYFCLRSEKSNS
jgi:hypothetical protein